MWDPNTVALSSTIQNIVPPDVTVAAGPILSNQGSLFADEYDAIARAVLGRRQEFTAGRSYARAALRRIGCADQAIRSAADRRPLWPLGFVGSISHTRDVCGAIVAKSSRYLGLGLDIESNEPLEPDLYNLIGSRGDIRPLSPPIETELGLVDQAKLIFSAKESVFKACNPVNGRWLDFHEVYVELNCQRQTFVATLASGYPLLSGIESLTGHWAVLEKHVVTAICVRTG